jgi:arylsulfatase A-like enzyme
MVSYPDPHGPNSVRAPYDKMYQDVKVPIPRSVNKTREQTPVWAAKAPKITADTVRLLMPKYYGMVKCLDDNIGRILDTLRKNGQIERTIIVFTSDHGDLCGEHGRLNKGVPFEGSARIPFLIYTPGKIKGGTVVDEALSCVDFLPTVMSLMDVNHGLKVDGRNAANLFRAKGGRWRDLTFLRSTSNPQAQWLCAVSDRYKLVYASSGKPWLFDLQKDADELTNRFTDPTCQAIVREMTGGLIKYCKTQKDTYGEVPHIKAAMAAAVKE